MYDRMPVEPPRLRAIERLKALFKFESFGGALLFTAALLAIFCVNSGFRDEYHTLLNLPLGIELGPWGLRKPILLWVNDGLMAVFFLLVGLELKREFAHGHLASRDTILLPLIAAAGGMLVPALVYTSFAAGHETAMRGWAIPAATDIAFALGVLSLFGRRVPVALKLFLTALAIFDDLGAIIIIALFYTANLSLPALAVAAGATLLLLICNRFRFQSLLPYLLIGLVLWVAVLKSGVHATLAGVIVALAIPAGSPEKPSLLTNLEHLLQPWVAYFILPVFASMNAGVDLSGLSMEILTDPVTLGVTFGLFVGKQVGIFGASWAAVKAGVIRLPAELSWGRLYAVSIIAGIGFTMSLFIGNLAFSDHLHLTCMRLGVILGSLLSGVTGVIVLSRVLQRG